MGNWNAVREPRVGVMLHYDASSSDRGAVQWLLNDPAPRCHTTGWCSMMGPWWRSPGRYASVARGHLPTSDPRTPYRDANSAFWGLSVAATDGDVATTAQKAAVADLCRQCFKRQGWPLTQVWRIVGHSTECWPRNRKVDPEGSDPRRPVLSVWEIRGWWLRVCPWCSPSNHPPLRGAAPMSSR